MDSRLPPRFSTYLDIIRVVAALVVLFSHYPLTQRQADITNHTNFAYDAVIVFFVLSGYVIAYAAQNVDRTGSNYAINRMARILPVALAATGIAWMGMRTGYALRPELYHDAYQLTNAPSYAMVSGFFLNQVWWLNIGSFDNGPYWSLSYEVFYYLIYGLAMFSGKYRFAWAALALVVAGPKIAIMFVVWGVGALAYKYRDSGPENAFTLRCMLLMPFACYCLVAAYLPWDWSYPYIGAVVSEWLGLGLEGAANFGWGYLLAILFSVHLFAARKLLARKAATDHSGIGLWAKKAASYTFTLYIVHYPVILLSRAFLGTAADGYNLEYKLYVLIYLAGVVLIVAKLCEHPKRRYRLMISGLFKGVQDFSTRLVAAALFRPKS